MHAAVILSNLSWTNHCLSDLPPKIQVISSFLYSKHISCMCVNYNVVHHNVKAILTKMQQKPNNWMDSGATLTQVTFSSEFFLLQTCLNFCMFFKMFSCIFLGEMLLLHFVAFIVHALKFCPRFSQKQSANQPKTYKGMLYYLIQKHMQKFKHLWRKKFTRSSHLGQSCTKPFSCAHSSHGSVTWSNQWVIAVVLLNQALALLSMPQLFAR